MNKGHASEWVGHTVTWWYLTHIVGPNVFSRHLILKSSNRWKAKCPAQVAWFTSHLHLLYCTWELDVLVIPATTVVIIFSHLRNHVRNLHSFYNVIEREKSTAYHVEKYTSFKTAHFLLFLCLCTLHLSCLTLLQGQRTVLYCGDWVLSAPP